MTFEDYIGSPMGHANAVMTNRQIYGQFYTQKLDKIMVREAGNVKYKAYHVGNRYICHIKIPSEVVSKFYYDVVIEFSPTKDSEKSNDLKGYNAAFYSNDPAFVFTFAHAFIKNKMFFKELESKMSKKALKEPGKVKNPKDQVGYVKSLYFAYILMNRKGLFAKTKYTDPYNRSAFMKSIMHADEKIEARQEAASGSSREKKKEKQALKDARSLKNTQSPETPIKTKPLVTKVVGKTKTTKTTARVGKTKRK